MATPLYRRTTSTPNPGQRVVIRSQRGFPDAQVQRLVTRRLTGMLDRPVLHLNRSFPPIDTRTLKILPLHKCFPPVDVQGPGRLVHRVTNAPDDQRRGSSNAPDNQRL